MSFGIGRRKTYGSLLPVLLLIKGQSGILLIAKVKKKKIEL